MKNLLNDCQLSSSENLETSNIANYYYFLRYEFYYYLRNLTSPALRDLYNNKNNSQLAYTFSDPQAKKYLTTFLKRYNLIKNISELTYPSKTVKLTINLTTNLDDLIKAYYIEIETLEQLFKPEELRLERKNNDNIYN